MGNTEDKQHSIAKEIIRQIRVTDPSALMAWGSKDFVYLPESKEYSGGVQFKVNGLKFKGFVRVNLRWVDDYTVEFINSKTGQPEHTIKDVYCDELVSAIDYVEGK